jgi:RNA polymerase sigma-70 factor (ECF subfamily)
VDEGGEVLLLAEQDRSRWDRNLIHLGLHHLELASAGEELSEYHLQAGIAATHAVAAGHAATDWPRVLFLYDQLWRLTPTPVVALNRAVAVAMAHGPQAGLAALDGVPADTSLKDYYLLPATRADFLVRLGRRAEAAAWYRRALEMTCTEPERRFLARRLEECKEAPESD